MTTYLCPTHGRCKGCAAKAVPLPALLPHRSWRTAKGEYRWPYYFLVGESRALRRWTECITDQQEREYWQQVGYMLIEAWTRYASARIWEAGELARRAAWR